MPGGKHGRLCYVSKVTNYVAKLLHKMLSLYTSNTYTVHIHTCAHISAHTNVLTYTHTYTHIHTYTYMHAYAHKHTYTHIHTHTHTYTHMNTHEHTYTQAEGYRNVGEHWCSHESPHHLHHCLHGVCYFV